MTETNELTSEEYKKLGNDAFAAKNYNEAIINYTNAIKLDPDNAVLYSNRCACYSSLKSWQAAIEDASTCVTKDPSFIKGYYRLATAYTEVGNYDDAINVLQTALSKEPDNDQLQKQLRLARSKKNAAQKQKSRPVKQLDETQKKELYELQEQTNQYARDLRGVTSSLALCQRDIRSTQVTLQQINTYDESSTNLYRSIGKSFLLTSKPKINEHLQNENEKLNKTQKDLESRKEYLERRIANNKSNIADITAGAAI
mmetsp:Transcript_10793/g.11216  ORF Transcript_10793/g.11216 Transcript_10793/m.11216 type:complete len:256 (-) Transcript_10793:67-834(-)